MQLKLVMACAMAAASSIASAEVISNTNLKLGNQTGVPGEYAITAYQDPAHTDPTTIWFMPKTVGQVTTLTVTAINADQGADYYLMPQGASFTPAAIASGQYKSIDNLEVPFNASFYLGVATTGYPSATFMERNVFGWIKIQNDASGLTMLGNAMAYHEGGIIVGTTQAVPEASTWALMLMGLGGVAALGTRRRAACTA